MKLSIIIPVYNVEKYIERCLVSIADQHLSGEDCETIIVVDGSTDRSAEICERLQDRLPCPTILRQRNQGVGVARNNGLLHARGKYVLFVDSDDYLEPVSVAEIVATACKYDLDVLGYEYRLDYGDHTVERDTTGKIYGQLLSPVDFMCNGMTMFPAWEFLLKRELLLDNELRFEPRIYHEDLELLPRIIMRAKRLMAVPGRCYIYVKHPNSALSDKSQDNVSKLYRDLIYVAGKLDAFIETLELSAADKERLYRLLVVGNTVLPLSKLLSHSIKNKERARQIRSIYFQTALYPLRHTEKGLYRLIFNHKPVFDMLYHSHLFELYTKFR